MKKNLIYLLAVTLLMGLFAACSQEETPEGKAGKSKLVSISAELPAEFAKTRALPTTNGHQLRCILEVWTKDATPVLVHHMEQVGDQATDDKLAFEFYLDNGTYNCLMWADFIDASAKPTDGRYADKYYNTADLKKVTIIDATKLYNNDACDGFFAAQELVKTDEMGSFDATLKRPFAKLVVSEKNKANFDLCKKVTASHRVPASFNVAEGTASKTETVASELTDAAPIGAGNTDLSLFSCYAFADEEGALKQITLSFKDASDVELRNTSIPAGVAFQRNHCTKAKGHLIAAASNNTTVDVGVSDGWDTEIDGGEVEPVDPVREPEVGDYFYEDGTWSAVLNKNKTCVGIVFDLAAEDSKDNYPSLTMNKINGWVIAINDISPKSAWANAAISAPIEGVAFLESLSNCNTEILGYKNSKAIGTASISGTTFPANAVCTAWTPSIAKTSGWYMPSIGQLIKLFNTYKTLNPKFTESGGMEIAGDVYLSSTLYKGNIPLGITFKEGDINMGTPRGQKIASPYNARAILTF